LYSRSNVRVARYRGISRQLSFARNYKTTITRVGCECGGHSNSAISFDRPTGTTTTPRSRAFVTRDFRRQPDVADNRKPASPRSALSSVGRPGRIFFDTYFSFRLTVSIFVRVLVTNVFADARQQQIIHPSGTRDAIHK